MTVLDREVTLCRMASSLKHLSDDELGLNFRRLGCYGQVPASLADIDQLDHHAERYERTRRKTMAKHVTDYREELIDAATSVEVLCKLLLDRPNPPQIVQEKLRDVTRWRLLASIDAPEPEAIPEDDGYEPRVDPNAEHRLSVRQVL